jgi:hypothetical protein
MTTISATDTSTNGTIHRFGVRNRADSAAVVPRSVTKVAAMVEAGLHQLGVDDRQRGGRQGNPADLRRPPVPAEPQAGDQQPTGERQQERQAADHQALLELVA